MLQRIDRIREITLSFQGQPGLLVTAEDSAADPVGCLAPWLVLSAADLRGTCASDVARRSVGSGECLHRLTLRNNHAVTTLPSSQDEVGGASSLAGLRELVLNNAPLVSSLDSVASQLVTVGGLGGQPRRRFVRESNLQTLFIRANRAMKELPLLMPSSLLSITLKDTALTSLDSLARCRLLVELDVSSNRHLIDLPASLNFGECMPYLRRLNASQTRIATIDGLRECPSLEVLVLDSTPNLRSLVNIPSLRELYVNYSGVVDLRAIEEHPCLEVLEAAWNRELSAVPCLPSIRVLRLEGCSLLMELGMLHGNQSLEKLYIEHCRLVSSLPSLPRLRVLSATCTGLTSNAVEECFAGHEFIEELSLRGCPGIRREIRPLPSLRKVVVDDDNCV